MPKKAAKIVVDEPKEEIIDKLKKIELKADTKKHKDESSDDEQTPRKDTKEDPAALEEKAQNKINEKIFNVKRQKDSANVKDFVASLSNIGLNYKTNEQTPVLIQTLFVPPEQRRTKGIMTKFEFSQVLSTRAQQISDGSPIFVSTGNLTSVNAIALKEIKEKKCPLTIQRVLTHYANGNKLAELWEVNELAIPDEYSHMKFE